MGYTHFDKVSGINGIAVGKKGSEIEVVNSSGTVVRPVTGNVTGNVTGALAGGEVNPSVACIADGDIAKGELVYPSGYDATSGKLKMKIADADATAPAKVAWFVAPAAIANNAAGTVVGAYELDGQDTSSASAVGDPVYLDTTAGAWTLTAPTGGGHAVQQVGVVTVKNASTGKVLLIPFYSKAVTVNTTA